MNEQIQKQLQERIEAFASDVTGILTDAVAQAVADALGSRRETKKTPASAAPKRVTQRDKAGRRTRAQVQREADQLLREVKRKSGQRMEQIAKNLRLSTKALALPMHALLKARKVKKTGVARGTTYRAA